MEMNDNYENERNQFFDRLKKQTKNGSFTNDERTQCKKKPNAPISIYCIFTADGLG